MADPQDLLLGQLAVKKGLISSQQLAAALGKQEELRAVGRKQPLGEILEAEGLVDRPAIQELLRSQAKSAVRELGGFELISRLGAGGMGTVYKARQKSMDRIVALKVLPPRLARDRIFIERFFREARAVARLNHSNIVQGIDVGEASGYYYFAMEFVEGRSLRDLLEQKGRFSEQEALDFVEQMARALDHAHKNGLIHRDVKPDNVLVDKTGVAKLCDLGLSRSSQEDASLTQTGVAMGTPHYIAPEQARAEKDVDGRADLYSLGATWFHLLAGAPPFTADSAMAIVAKHLTEAAPSVRTVRPDVSAATASAVSRLMAKERAERYQSAEELLKDIADLRAGRMPAVAASGFSGEITVAAPPKPAAPPRVRDTRAYPPVDLPEVVPVARGGRTAPTLPVSAPGAGAGGGAVKLALAAGVLLAAVLVGWVIKRNIAGPAEDPGSRPPISETGPATTQNPTANPGTGPATGAKPTPDRMGQLEDMHQYVLKTTGEKPDDLALLTSQWEQLRDAGKGTKYQLMADEELRKLAVRREELDRRRFEPVRAKLDDLERRVDGHLAARRFGEARDALKEFALDPGAPGDLVRRLADLNARSDSAGNTAVKTVADDALRFAEGGRFPEARKTLDALTAFGLPAAAEAHRSTSVRIGELERDAARRRDEEARRRCEQVLSRVGPRVESRDFAGALAEIDKVSKGLPDDVAGQVRAERAIVAAAAGFMERCRERAAAQPVGVRLVYKGISAPLKSYDPGTETLTLGEGGASFPARLAELEPEQLLVLAGSREPAKLPAAEALAAGCFLASQKRGAQAEPYLAAARKGGAVGPELERALEARVKGAAEARAEEDFRKFEAARAARRWQEARDAGARLLAESSETAFLKPRLATVRQMAWDAEDQLFPADTSLPRDARIYTLAGEEEARALREDFDFRPVARRPVEKGYPLTFADGVLSCPLEDGQSLGMIARNATYGQSRSFSFDVDCSEKRFLSRGRVVFGFVLANKGDERRLALLLSTAPGGEELSSQLQEEQGGAGRLLSEGRKAVAAPNAFFKWRLRISWKEPFLVWFVNGQRVGMARLPAEQCRIIGASRVVAVAGLADNEVPEDSLRLRVRRLSLGAPQPRDFEGTEGIPDPNMKPRPPEHQPQPQPQPQHQPRPPQPGPWPQPQPRPEPQLR